MGPEQKLIEKGYICNTNKKAIVCNPLVKNSWYNNYLFEYNNVNKEKLLELLFDTKS